MEEEGGSYLLGGQTNRLVCEIFGIGAEFANSMIQRMRHIR